MKPLKIVSTVFSAAVLLAGMVWFVSIAGSKFGMIEGGRDGYQLRDNLRTLQTAQLAHDAAFDSFFAAPPCPADTPEPAWCPPAVTHGLLWEPDPSWRYGRYWVELSADGTDFTAHAQRKDFHYVVHAHGDPERAE